MPGAVQVWRNEDVLVGLHDLRGPGGSEGDLAQHDVESAGATGLSDVTNATHTVRGDLIVSTDADLGQMVAEDRIQEWVSGASDKMLASAWRMADESELVKLKLQYCIAAEFKRRIGLSSWADEAGRILRRGPDTVRDYALIWERLGKQIDEDIEVLSLGFKTLLAIASQPDVPTAIAQATVLKDSGASVRQIRGELDTGYPTACERHDYRCKRCGERATA